jgi:uncharacterized integral membrane protein
MKTKTLVILILVALVGVLLLQNAGLTQLQIFFWYVYAPLFVLLLVVFCLGLLVGLLAHRRDRKKEPKTAADKAAVDKSAAPVFPPPPVAKTHP